jgi:hypothetical protein
MSNFISILLFIIILSNNLKIKLSHVSMTISLSNKDLEHELRNEF